MPTLLPSAVTKLRASGNANMGTVGDDNVPGTFRHPDNVPWVLVSIQLHFRDLSGSATLTADCSIYRDRRSEQTAWNGLLWKMLAVGIGAEGNLVIPPDELYLWTFDADEAVTLTWTNPDSGNIGWGVEVGVAPASAVRA